MEHAPDTTASHFDVLILGPFALYRDGSPVDTSGWQRKVHTLFRLLLTAPAGRYQRDEAMEILWPETSSEAGTRNLRVVLHMLRKGLGGGEPSPILSEGGWIALNPAHHWDVDLSRFESLALEAGKDLELLEEAASYHRGEPLSEDRYGDWAIAIRERIQREWRDVCLRLAELDGRNGEAQAALGWLDRIVAIDPLDEEAVRLSLEILAETARRTEAMRRYQNFERRLREALGIEPGRETLAVVEKLRKQNRTEEHEPQRIDRNQLRLSRPLPVLPRALPPSGSRLSGREEELGRILWMLPPMYQGGARLVFLSGEAGTGKTRLLTEVAERARSSGLLTLAGAAYSVEGGLAYGPLRDALGEYVESQPEDLVRAHFDSLASHLSPILPELLQPAGDAQAGDGRVQLFLAVKQALERISRDAPLVLLLDNLHDADPGSLQMLHFVARNLAPRPILVVAAHDPDKGRGSELEAMAGDMEQEGWAIRIQLHAP